MDRALVSTAQLLTLPNGQPHEQHQLQRCTRWGPPLAGDDGQQGSVDTAKDEQRFARTSVDQQHKALTKLENVTDGTPCTRERNEEEDFVVTESVEACVTLCTDIPEVVHSLIQNVAQQVTANDMMCGDQEHKMVSRDRVPTDNEPKQHTASKSQAEQPTVLSNNTEKEHLDCPKHNSSANELSSEQKKSEISVQSTVGDKLGVVECSKQDTCDTPEAENVCASDELPETANPSLPSEATLPKAQNTQSTAPSNDASLLENLNNRIEEYVSNVVVNSAVSSTFECELAEKVKECVADTITKVCAASIQTDDKCSSVVNNNRLCDILVDTAETVKEGADSIQSDDERLLDSNEIVVDSLVDRPCDILANKPAEEKSAAVNVMADDDNTYSSSNGLSTTPLESTHKTDECTQTDLKLPIVESNAQDEATDTAVNSSYSPCDSTASEHYSVAMNKTESVTTACATLLAHSSNTNDGNNEESAPQSDENGSNNKCVSSSPHTAEVKSDVLQCVSNVCDVVECVSSVLAETATKPQVFPELPIPPAPKAKSVTTKPPKQATARRNKRQCHSKSVPSALPIHLPHLMPSKSVCSTEPTTQSSSKPFSSSMHVSDQGVLDLTTKPKKCQVERVKPITRLSNRGLSQVFGQIAFPEDRSDFVLKVPSVRKLSHPSVPLDLLAPTLETTPSSSVPKKKNCVHVHSPTQTDKFIFQIEDYHHTLTPKGQKIFTCEICSGVYQRSFSLKRHYLRSHINYKHLTARDISNCGIVVGDKMSIQAGSNNKTVIQKPAEPPPDESEPRASLPDLYRCHTCGLCFDYKHHLKKHLENHPLTDSSISSKPYSCIHCPAQFTHQHNYKKHQSFHSHLTSNTPFSPSSSAVAYPCSYCYKAFPSQAVRKKHIQQHREASSHACMFLCGESFLELQLLRQHLLTTHGREYLGCPSCEERFLERSILEEHKLLHHGRQEMEQPSISITVEQVPVVATSETSVNHSVTDVEVQPPAIVPQVEKQAEKPTLSKSDSGEFRYTCAVCNKMFTNYVNMCRHRRLAHGTVGKHTKPQKSCETGTSDECPSPQTTAENGKQAECESAAPPPSNDCAVESNVSTKVSCKIPNNLLNYLDGKLQAGSSCKDLDMGRTVSLTSELTITALPMEETSKNNCVDESSESQDYSSADDIVTPTSHSHRLAWEKYSFPKNYCGRSVDVLELEDMSYLDIATQLAMKSKAADKALTDDSECDQAATFLWQELGLIETPLKAVEQAEPSATEDQEKSQLSGEWIRPRSYICCTCADKFADLWQLEDHMYAAHHNVWWTFLELDASTPVPSDLFHRMLNAGGALCSADQVASNATADSVCTKCGRTSHSQAELHRHMLECGGDFSLLFSPTRRKSKWRPFGSRRRRQQGRRGMKRNIPNSPVKLHRGRPRGVDSANDTIQRMIANLPAKRASRRVIQFTEDEIKTRSQATIHNVAFSLPFPRLPKKPNKMSCLNIQHKRRGRPKLDSTQKKSERLNSGSASDVSTALQLSPVSKLSLNKSSTEEEGKVVKKKKHSIMNETVAGKSCSVKEEDTQRQQLFPSEPPFICNGCGAEFVASSACERHAKKCVYRHLFQLDSDTPKATLSCTHCNKTFVLAGCLEKHMKNCVKLVPVKSENICSHCNKSFVFATALEKHTKNCSKVEDDLEMPRLQKEEPLKVNRTKKTLPNIPVLSPVNQAQKMEVPNNIKKRGATRRKCVLPEVDPVKADSKPDSIEKQPAVPDQALPPNLPLVEAKTVPVKKIIQKTKPLTKKVKKMEKVGITKLGKPTKTKMATDALNPTTVSVGKKTPLSKLERKTKKVLNGRASNKTKACNSSKLTTPEVAAPMIKAEPVDEDPIQNKVKAKPKAKRQAIVKEVINKTEIESITVRQEAVAHPKSRKKLREKERGKPAMKVALFCAPEKASKFQSNGVLQDHDDNKMGKVTKRKYKMKAKANTVVADINVTVNEIEAPATTKIAALAKKQKAVAKLNNKFAAKSVSLDKLGKKLPVKKQLKRKRKVDDISKKRMKLSPDSPILSATAPEEQRHQPDAVPMETTSVSVAIKTERVEKGMCEEQNPEEPSLNTEDTAGPSVAEVDTATTSTEVVPPVPDMPPKVESSSEAAATSDCLWCEVCNKLYSSAFNLLKHRGSLKHKRNAEAATIPTKEMKSEGNASQGVVNDAAQEVENDAAQEVENDTVQAAVNDSVQAAVNDSVQATVNDSTPATVNDSVPAVVNDSVQAAVNDSVPAVVNDSAQASVNDSAQEVLNSTAEQLDLYINCPTSEDVDAKLPRDEFDSNFVVPPAPPPSPIEFELQESAVDKVVEVKVNRGTKRGRGKRRFSKKRKQHKGDRGVPVEDGRAVIEIKSEINMDLEVPPTLSPEQSPPDTTALADQVNTVEHAQLEAVFTEEQAQPEVAAQVAQVECITLVKTSELLKKEEPVVKRSNSLTEEKEIVPVVVDEEPQKAAALENAEPALKVTSQCSATVSSEPISDVNNLDVPPASLGNTHTAEKVEIPPTNSSAVATKTEPGVSSVTCSEFVELPNPFPYGWSSDSAASLASEQAAPSREIWSSWNGYTLVPEWTDTYYPSSSSSVPPPPTPASSQPTPNSSFGAILGSVHQVLEDGVSEYASSEYSVSGQALPDCPNPYLMDPFDGRQSLEEIQKAMGATDEEMAMLQQFGQGSLGSHEFVYDNNASQAGSLDGEALQPLDNPDLIDLDNQASNSACSEPQDPQLSPSLLLDEAGDVGRYMSQFEGGDGLPPSIIPTTKLLSVYEKKEMVCPVCNRHFLGLQALETHIAWVHKVKDTKSRIFQKKETSSARDGWCATGYSSLLAREPGCLVGSAAGVVLGSAGGIRGGVLRAAAGAAAEAAEGSSTKKRKLACFVCKELYSDVIALNRHIAQLHLKKKGDSDKDGGLKSQMSTALGGLLDRALSNMLGKAGRNSNQNLRELNKVDLLPSGLNNERPEEEEQHENATPQTIFKQEPVVEDQDDTAMETSESFQNHLLTDKISPYSSDRFSTESSRDEQEREVAAIQLSGGFCKVETSERETILPDDPPSSTYTLPEQPSIQTPEQIAFTQSIERTVPEPPSDELQCPVCLAAMKHYHSLCRHLKTQHCEWNIQAFSTDMYNYLIIKRDSPPELIRKKYSITIPGKLHASGASDWILMATFTAPRSTAAGPTSTSKSEPDLAESSEAADILQGRRPSKPCSNSSGNNSDSGSLTPRQALEQEADHDSIRAKAFAALRQLNQRPSRSGRVQTVPIRGSKRRPLDIYEFFEDEEVETPPLRQSSTPRQEKKSSSDLNEGDTKESVGIDLPTESELTSSEDIYGTYECNTCSKSFKSLKAYCRHSQDVCKPVYSYDSSSDDNDLESMNFTRKQENTQDTATDKSASNCDKTMDSGLQLICHL